MTVLLFVAALAQDFDAKKELGRSVERLVQAKSYQYKSISASESASGGGGRRGGGPTEIEGKYHADSGLVAAMGGTKVVRKGEQVAYNDEAGNWQVIVQPDWAKLQQEQQSRQGGGAQGFNWQAMRYLGVTAPHGALKGLSEKLAEVDVEENTERVGDSECVVVKSKLTKEAIDSMMSSASGGRSMWRRGGDSQGGTPPESTGTARFWLDDAGDVCKIETVVNTTGNWGGGSYSWKTTTTTSFSGVNQTEVEMPRRAEEAFQKAADKSAAEKKPEEPAPGPKQP